MYGFIERALNYAHKKYTGFGIGSGVRNMILERVAKSIHKEKFRFVMFELGDRADAYFQEKFARVEYVDKILWEMTWCDPEKGTGQLPHILVNCFDQRGCRVIDAYISCIRKLAIGREFSSTETVWPTAPFELMVAYHRLR